MLSCYSLDSGQDAFVFKKPMMTTLPGGRNKTGQQQGGRGNLNKGRGGQKNQRGRAGRNQHGGRQNKSGFSF